MRKKRRIKTVIWLGTVACCLIAATYLTSLGGAYACWLPFGERHVIGLASGSCYVYWAAEPPTLSNVEFAAQMAAFHEYPARLTPARSSIGAIVPLWLPLAVIAIPTAWLWSSSRGSDRPVKAASVKQEVN